MTDGKEPAGHENPQNTTKFNANLSNFGNLSTLNLFMGDRQLTAYETLSARCIFSRTSFEDTLLNLIRHPNITSSHLFRADVLYDSNNDASYVPNSPTCENEATGFSSFTKHMKLEYRPLSFHAQGYEFTRTVVRQLIPRNPNLDAPLVQTCHFLTSGTTEAEHTMVVYLPHVESEDAMPFYHPAVQMLAFNHSYSSDFHASGASTTNAQSQGEGKVSIIASPFPATQPAHSISDNETYTFSKRLTSTFTNLLRTIHKHATSQKLQNYTKRVHHDQIVPQKAFQDTYTQLKLQYAKGLIANWQENTDPGKHVFEDLGISAFLIELWKQQYGTAETAVEDGIGAQTNNLNQEKFPGFVDIGCGNGLLVNLLRKEGYEGWGFDVRKRKSWSGYEATVQHNLQEKVLVPYILEGSTSAEQLLENGGVSSTTLADSTISPKALAVEYFYGGFPKSTFIVSNHADELTAWTPILAYLSQCPFIAIPCCSHDLSGLRTRFPPRSDKGSRPKDSSAMTKSREVTDSQPKTGSLARPAPGKSPKAPSAYSTLCDYVTRLAEELGFSVEKEMLRIPSTRNAAILGRLPIATDGKAENREEREARVRGILERELGTSISNIRQAWLGRASKIAATAGAGH